MNETGVIFEIKNAQQEVREILEQDPNTSTEELIVKIAEKVYKRPLPELRRVMLDRIVRPETIRRARQKLQEQHAELRPNADIQNARKAREDVFHEVMGGRI